MAFEQTGVAPVQVVFVAAVQLPLVPLQTVAPTAGPVADRQVAAVHCTLVPGYPHAVGLPMQDPRQGDVPTGLHLRVPRGAVFPMTVTQVPTLPLSMHDWQVPVQAAEQQTPSVQEPLMHSVPSEQPTPLALRVVQEPLLQVSVPLQVLPPQHA